MNEWMGVRGCMSASFYFLILKPLNDDTVAQEVALFNSMMLSMDDIHDKRFSPMHPYKYICGVCQHLDMGIMCVCAYLPFKFLLGQQRRR